jgi:hypothetical protein
MRPSGRRCSVGGRMFGLLAGVGSGVLCLFLLHHLLFLLPQSWPGSLDGLWDVVSCTSDLPQGVDACSTSRSVGREAGGADEVWIHPRGALGSSTNLHGIGGRAGHLVPRPPDKTTSGSGLGRLACSMGLGHSVWMEVVLEVRSTSRPQQVHRSQCEVLRCIQHSDCRLAVGSGELVSSQ